MPSTEDIDERQPCAIRHPVYTDYLDRGDDWITQRWQQLGVKSSTGAKKKFPMLLYRLLEDVEGTERSLLIRWLPHGRAFVVVDKTRFVDEVQQTYFPRQKEYTSFQRQLNIYGFLRFRRDDDGYYHELFLRSQPSLVHLIQRPTRALYTSRQTFDASSEPNFYAMVWLPDISKTNANDAANDTEPYVIYYTAASPLPVSHSFPPSSRLPRPDRRNAPATPHISDQYAATLQFTHQPLDSGSIGAGSVFRTNHTVHSPNRPEQHAQVTTWSTRDVEHAYVNDANCPQQNNVDHIFDETMNESVQNRADSNDAHDDCDLETLSDLSCASMLSDWANFLHDVDLDCSSSDTDEKERPVH